MTTKSKGWIEQQQSGQSLVELSFSLVIILILLAGVVDFGRAFFTFMALRDAAQEGAVFGSICPTDSSRIISRVRLTSTHPVDFSDTSSVQVACSFQTGGGEVDCASNPAVQAGDAIRVNVTLNNFPITMPFLGTILGRQTIPLQAEAMDTVLRKECP